MAFLFKRKRSDKVPQQQKAGNNSQSIQVGKIGKAGRDINISVSQPPHSEESPLQRPTMDEVRIYDPKHQKLVSAVKSASRVAGGAVVAGAAVAAVAGAAITKLLRKKR